MPDGYIFLNWRNLEGGSIASTMPAYGLDLYAAYQLGTIQVYVDYNNNSSLPLTETMALSSVLSTNPLYYGDDVEREMDIEAGIEMGIGDMVRNSIITDGNRPGENYEVVDWKIYYVDEGKDPYDKENWKEGINSEGTTIAKTTLIFQTQWKHHTEFFFRVYSTDGKIYMALGKNFKLYYWNNNYVCERNETSLNKNSDGTIVLLLLPTIENWDWNRFFEADMWSNITLRFDPLFAPKSMFTPEGMLGLFQALGNLIKSLL